MLAGMSRWTLRGQAGSACCHAGQDLRCALHVLREVCCIFLSLNKFASHELILAACISGLLS